MDRLTRPQHDCIAKYFAHYTLILEENGLKQRSANYCGLIPIHFHNLICYVHGQTIPVNNLTTDQNKQFKDGHWSFILEVKINHNKSYQRPPCPNKTWARDSHYVLSACLGICRKTKLDCAVPVVQGKALVLSNELNAAFGHQPARADMRLRSRVVIFTTCNSWNKLLP